MSQGEKPLWQTLNHYQPLSLLSHKRVVRTHYVLGVMLNAAWHSNQDNHGHHVGIVTQQEGETLTKHKSLIAIVDFGGADKMAQEVTALRLKPNTLNLTPKMVGGEK